jgi:hypothetical protein
MIEQLPDGPSIAELDRLENLIGVCVRDYKYASQIGDAERASKALSGIAEHSAALGRLAG